MNQEHELAELRRKVAQLERENQSLEADALAAKHPDDPRFEALLRAGCSRSALSDAARLFRVSDKLGDRWREQTEDIERMAKQFVEDRPYLMDRKPEPEPSEPGGDRPYVKDGELHYPNGVSLPVDSAGLGLLADAAGPPPKPEPKPEPPKLDKPFSEMTMAELAQQAGDI